MGTWSEYFTDALLAACPIKGAGISCSCAAFCFFLYFYCRFSFICRQMTKRRISFLNVLLAS